MPKISRLVSQTWWKIPKEIRDRIEAAEKLKESQLNLSSSDIHELVKQIIQLNHLTKFNLSKNYISEIPPEIGKFQALRHLDISYNTLSKLPVEFQHLKGLEVPDFDPQVLIIDGNQLSNNPSHGLDGLKELSMSSNQVKDLLSLPGGLVALNYAANGLEKVPEPIVYLHHLTMLNLSGNRLAAVPDISAMHSLRRLDLARNALTEFPVTVCSCAQLVELLLTGNRITNLPRDLEQLGNLEYLEMNECRVGLIDLDFTKLSKLTHLLFSQCRVEEISLLARSTLPALQQLQHLDLVRCRIKDLPPELGQLRALQKLWLNHNAFTALPGELCDLHPSCEVTLDGNALDGPFKQFLGQNFEAFVTKLQPFCSAVAEFCTLTGPHSFATNTPCSLEVRTFDWQKRPRLTGGDLIVAELKADEETEEQFEVIVKDEGKAAPGVYHLYFNLARPGPYKLHVLLENKLSHVREDIPGSPHAITLD